MIRSILFITVAVLAAGVAAACAEGDAQERVQVRTLTGANLRFAPATVTVRAGRPVQLALKNPDAVDHDRDRRHARLEHRG
jgi:uncharacterized cupredoxin-like copper-binding protein